MTHAHNRPPLWGHPKLYCINVLIALDQLGNALMGGWADETISSALGKREVTGTLWWFQKPLVAALNWLQPNHCKLAMEYGGRHGPMPPYTTGEGGWPEGYKHDEH